MATQQLTAKTFPGVYSQVTDNSFLTPQTSRFSCGLIGVAQMGPFNVPTPIRSLAQFVQTFGAPLDSTSYLGNAVAILSDLTDGMQIVRVGSQYTTNATPGMGGVQASGTSGGTTLTSASGKGQIFSPAPVPYGQGQNVFIAVTQQGMPSTVNVQVTSASAGTISIAGNGVLAASYTSADVNYSNVADAAFQAEGVLYAYTYGTIAANQVDQPITAAGTVTGTKNAYSFNISGDYSAISVGDLLKIKGPNAVTTAEVRVKQVLPGGTISLETSDLPDVGYQALPLQDNYGAGSAVYLATGKQPFLFLQAASAGTWANGDDEVSGLFVNVGPGSAAGTKKLEVYVANALMETWDNLTENPSDPNFYSTQINGNSNYINVVTYYNPENQTLSAANLSSGWLVSPPVPMPFPGINAGGPLPSNGGWDNGGTFHNGWNGESAQNSDFVGTYDPTTDTYSGVQCFADTANTQVDVICAPGITDNVTTVSVHMAMTQTAALVNAVALLDVPSGLNLRQAVDWHNGAGPFTGRGRINSPNCACFWNWFTIADPFTSTNKLVPPTIGALRCLAYTFDAYYPWYAAAGDTRGLILEALAVEFPRVSDDMKQASYGNGQSVNSILLDRGQIKLYGERTMQVAESELSVVHTMMLVNYIVNNLSDIGRTFVFEPNDPTLLSEINLAFTGFLNGIENQQGLEDYLLVIDSTNNTAATRNLREVIVNLAIIPTETMERMYISITVNASGATLNSVLTNDTTT